jgi:two-component system nitrogen regulation response regulator GlnG
MSESQSVLIVDDEPAICWAFEKMLRQEGHVVHTASSAEEGLSLAKKEPPALVVLDVRLPNEDGLSALPKFIQASNHAPVIIITAFGDLETAVTAVKRGATDYLTKPFKLDDALNTCRLALRKSGRQPPSKPTETSSRGSHVLVGKSPAMQQVFRQIALVAESELSVLITGETGTGKELVAAAIHRHSQRADRPYLPISPVAFNAELVESELFGHTKGAFTGAHEDRPGLFERAEGGTVLLDEIGDLPLGTQVKLLRVLEQGEFCRVGDVVPRSANVRILAATNCDLPRSVARGTFREDLFHRLTGMQIHLPPLRERTEDLLPLCNHFLERIGYPDADSAVDASLLETLSKRPWNGNIRELKNAVEHAAVVARGRALSLEDFPAPKPGRDDSETDDSVSLDSAIADWTTNALHAVTDRGDAAELNLHSQFLAAVEPALLRVVLRHTGGNRAKAAEILGIHRGTLRERLRSYGIDEGSSN